MAHTVITNDERKELFEKLSKGIDVTELTLNEFIYASADLLKSTFWTSLSTGKEEEELVPIRERIGAAIDGIVNALDDNTENVAEDMVVISSIMLEAVSHVMAQEKGKAIPAE